MHPESRSPETVTASEIANWVYCSSPFVAASSLDDYLPIP
jgi:hypothetical protein